LIFDIAILGAGASAIMCARELKKVCLIDKNSQIGEKIKISGGGSCNFTNMNLKPDNYLGDKVFIKKVFDKFSNRDLIDFLKSKNLEFVNRKNSQLFCKNGSSDILNIFKRDIKNRKLYLNEQIIDVEFKKNLFEIKTDKKIIKSKYLVVASGGLSYSKIGATDIGYKIAKKFGHSVNRLNPALVGFTIQPKEAWFKLLSGVSLRASVRVGDKLFRDNILFTHKGLSGPAILNASLYWQKGEVEINFLNGEKLEKYLQNPNKQLVSSLPFSKNFIKIFLEQIGIKDKKIANLSSEELTKLKTLESYRFAPAGNFGYQRAEVTKGGIDTSEISEHFESLKQKNLFFIGEVLDVTGELGGYNFQFSFSSGVICGKYISLLLKT